MSKYGDPPKNKFGVDMKALIKDRLIDSMVFHQCDFQNFNLSRLCGDEYQFSFTTNNRNVNNIVIDMIYGMDFVIIDNEEYDIYTFML